MIKYCELEIVFREFPDEVTLAINISNCPHRCKGCHSPHLQKDIGGTLTPEVLEKLIEPFKDKVTCIGFMGGDADIEGLYELAKTVKSKFPSLRTGWYSGNGTLAESYLLDVFDYVKIGPYIEKLGPLDNPNTNQRLYKKVDGPHGEEWQWIPMFKDTLNLPNGPFMLEHIL